MGYQIVKLLPSPQHGYVIIGPGIGRINDTAARILGLENMDTIMIIRPYKSHTLILHKAPYNCGIFLRERALHRHFAFATFQLRHIHQGRRLLYSVEPERNYPYDSTRKLIFVKVLREADPAVWPTETAETAQETLAKQWQNNSGTGCLQNQNMRANSP